jgi:hypothetical protein
LLEGGYEMGAVLETHAKIDIRGVGTTRFQKLVGSLKTLIAKPGLRCHVANLGEVALEGGEASTRVVGMDKIILNKY